MIQEFLHMRKTICLAFVFSLSVLGCVSCFAQETTPPEFPPVPPTPVVAHRGFSSIAPENTLISAQKAIDIKASGCECDVRSSSDGILFLSHDENAKRTTGLDIVLADQTYDEIFKLDNGSWKGAEFKGEPIPTLDSWLALLDKTECRPVIEIKANGFEEKIVELIHKYDMVERAVVIDFSKDRVKKIRQLEPKLCVAWLCSFKVEEETPKSMAETIINTLKECNTNVVDVHFAAVSPEFLQILRNEGIHVWCWTVDAEADINRMLDMNVESITTNYPDRVLNCIKARETAEEK